MSRISKEERQEINRKTYKPLMWLGIMSIVMLFAGLISGHVVAKSDSIWVKIILPNEFLVSTYIIVASSITFFGAVLSIKKNKLGLSKLLIALTLVLGVLFVKSQWDGYKKLNEKGSYFTAKIDQVIRNAKYGEDYVLYSGGLELVFKDGYFYDPMDKGFVNPLNDKLDFEKSNRAASYLVALSGLHIVHLLGGILSLIFVFIKTLRNRYTPENNLGMQTSSIYWHFLDFLWLYLFVYLTFF
jgi:cytochrome c oxidase subunit 3